ncbi:hypothetical protein DAEQUDRAFT_348746 [Daedalea quercina L-15889]|uniref:Uncharacterized protein n=1 Tax=Daedalea quercina L-15889 TaxID=1314783 RepID=A0A165PDK3_9APHY|nr:hypothetical protein DAEQUDRAFT_348746 [Daedalea quercina L-15889]
MSQTTEESRSLVLTTPTMDLRTTTLVVNVRQPMPLPSSETGPRFSGKRLDDFLYEFEIIAGAAQLTDTEKCNSVLHYCSDSVRGTLGHDAAFRGDDWGRARERLIFYYSDRDAKTRVWAAVAELRRYSSRYHEDHNIRNVQDFGEYLRGFARRAGSLVEEEEILEAEHDLLFYHGLPPPLRCAIKPTLLQLGLTLRGSGLLESPPTVKQVADAVRAHFSEDDEEHSSSDDSDGNSSDESDNESGSPESALQRNMLALSEGMVRLTNLLLECHRPSSAVAIRAGQPNF